MSEIETFRVELSPQKIARQIVDTAVASINQMGFSEKLSVNVVFNVKNLLPPLERMLGQVFSSENLKRYLPGDKIEGSEGQVNIITLRGLIVALLKEEFISSSGEIQFGEENKGTFEQRRFKEDCLLLIDRKNISAV